MGKEVRSLRSARTGSRGHREGVRIADWATAYTELKSEFDQAQANWGAAAREKDDQIERLSASVNQLQVTIDSAATPVMPASPERPLGMRERESLLKLVIGMAVKGYTYDPRASRSASRRRLRVTSRSLVSPSTSIPFANG